MSNHPLSGLYQDIQLAEDKIFPLKNKFSNFNLSRTIGIDNLFTLSSSFGKVFLNEKLDGLIIFANTSDYLITIKNLEISIIIDSKPDTKKKENVGNFKNNGSEYRPVKDPRKVLDHDFPLPELGKVSPYGVYVLNDNTGFVNLGLSHHTPEFAGESVSQWWRCVGKHTFPEAKRLYITCDSGGSNGCRIWLWKHYVQELANETGMEIHVSHFPTGTSKWNKVEHRLFCYISKNWQGQPLIDVETIVNHNIQNLNYKTEFYKII